MTLGEDAVIFLSPMMDNGRFDQRNKLLDVSSSSNDTSTDPFLVWWNSRSISQSNTRSNFTMNNPELTRYSKRSLRPGTFRSRSLSPLSSLRVHDCNKRHLNVSSDSRSPFNHENSKSSNSEDSYRDSTKELFWRHSPNKAAFSRNLDMTSKTLQERKKEKRSKMYYRLYRSSSVSNSGSKSTDQTTIEVRSYDSLLKPKQPKIFSFAKLSNSKSRQSSFIVSSVSLNEDFYLSSYQVVLLTLYSLKNCKFSARAHFEKSALKEAKKIVVEIVGYNLEVTFLDAEELDQYRRCKSRKLKRLLSRSCSPLKSSSSNDSKSSLKPNRDLLSSNKKKYKMTLPMYADVNTLEFAWKGETSCLEVSGNIKGCQKEEEQVVEVGEKGTIMKRMRSMFEGGNENSLLNCCSN